VNGVYDGPYDPDHQAPEVTYGPEYKSGTPSESAHPSAPTVETPDVTAAPLDYEGDDSNQTGNKDVTKETWIAKETLTLSGFEFRFGLSGMTMQTGTAIVEFSNGKDSFTKEFDVRSTYSEGLFFSIGKTTTKTNYTKTFDTGVGHQDIIDTFEGMFATVDVSVSTPVFLSGVGGKTYTIVPAAKEMDPSGWQGITMGGSVGLGVDCFPVDFGVQLTAYRDPSKENNKWINHPEWFFNMPALTEKK
jgi:hypothetical protein